MYNKANRKKLVEIIVEVLVVLLLAAFIGFTTYFKMVHDKSFFDYVKESVFVPVEQTIEIDGQQYIVHTLKDGSQINVPYNGSITVDNIEYTVEDDKVVEIETKTEEKTQEDKKSILDASELIDE